MRNDVSPRDAIVIVAGGQARRLPGKLERLLGERPLLLVVYENLRAAGPVYVAAKDTFSPATDAGLECPILIDRWPGQGPLAALLSAFEQVAEERIFAVAGDAPAITTEVLFHLTAAWQDGDEAAVPRHGERREPLAALYDREAFIREARILQASGNASMHALLDRLRVRDVEMPATYFMNINTAADWPVRND